MSEVLIWAGFLWKLYLTWRQRQVFRYTPSVPEELSDVIDHVTFERSRLYALDKIHFSMVSEVFSMGIHVGVHILGLQAFWDISEDFLEWEGFNGTDPMKCAVFVFLITTLHQIISIPFELYFHFVLEDKHGFNNQTVDFYMKEKLKSFFLSGVSTIALTYVIVSIVYKGGEYFYVYLWMFLAAYSILLAFTYPDVFLPLFDSFTALPTSEAFLVPVQTLLSRVNFPLARLKVLEASKRSSHSNAFTAGLFHTDVIVLYDTLLEDGIDRSRGCDKDEILGVIGHELGHWKLNHIPKLLFSQLAALLVALIAFAPMLKNLEMLFTVSRKMYSTVICGLTFLGFGQSWLSRRFEYEADEFTANLGLASYLRRALVKITKDNLQFPVEDWLYAAYHYSHPPLLHRLEALRRYE